MFAYSLVLLTVLISQNWGCVHNHNPPGNHHVNHPCKTRDLNCIRRFFAQTSDCNPVYTPAPDSVVFPRLELPVPHANLTFIGIYYVLRGMKDYAIRQFYVNTATRTLVFEIEFKEFNWNTSTALLRYHFKGREPVQLSDYFALHHRTISLTLVAPFTDGIEPSTGHVYTYIGDSNISFRSGPRLVNSDKAVRSAYRAFSEDYITTFKEGYRRAGAVVMWSFIQLAVCDYSMDMTTIC